MLLSSILLSQNIFVDIFCTLSMGFCMLFASWSSEIVRACSKKGVIHGDF